MVVMNIFFTSIELFQSLHKKEIYATGTVRSIRIGLPCMMKEKKEFAKSTQGTLDWRMHDDSKICAVMWKDKKPVCLLSTHARPITLPNETVEVPRRDGAVCKMVKTSPIHLQYTTYMRGVDRANHLRGNYSCQTRSHKWWHRIFWFLVDQSITNMWILHKEVMKVKNRTKETLSHFNFILGMCQSLIHKWVKKHMPTSMLEDEVGRIHCPQKSTLQRRCVHCKKRTNSFCALCAFQWMCYT